MNIGEIVIWESSNLLLLIPRRDRVAGIDALAEGTDSFHKAGLALSDPAIHGRKSFRFTT
jgi:hypothetical protein